MTALTGGMLARVIVAIGREPPPQNSVAGLSSLPDEVASDIESIYQKCGSICVFAYMRHVSGAAFDEVKLYLDNRGWHESVD
jgi:hypothetical protein